MSDGTLARRLEAARSRAFVGRAVEIELFRQALDVDDPPFSLLWFHGAGGAGKSTLLRRLGDLATADGARVVLVDARTVEATPVAIRSAVRWPDRPAGAPGSSGSLARPVLLLDTAERLAPVEDWLREEFLPGLPDGTVIVVASRDAPGPRWRADLGWSDVLRAVHLGDLEPAAAAAFLAHLGVAEASRARVIALTRGHPLALALMADLLVQRAGMPEDAAPVPTEADLDQVIPALLERFVDRVPDPLMRKGLHVFAHARSTTEGLLRDVLGEERAGECFDWLRGLAFSQVWTSGRLVGLVPHDLARDVLDRDARRRDPEAWEALHQQIRGSLVRRALSSSGAEQGRSVADLLWFHRNSPALSAYPSWDEAFSLWDQPARPTDLAEILVLVERFEPERSVRLHRAWWDRQPSAFWVIRRRPGEVHGFVVQLRLTEQDRAFAVEVGDPIAQAALDHVQRRAPLRNGQHLRVVRSWAGRDGYHRPSPTHQAITGLLTRTWLAEPGLAVSMAFTTDPQLWTPMFGFVDYARAPDAEVELDGIHLAPYVHDWRITSMPDWLDLLEQRARWEHRGRTTPGGTDTLVDEAIAEARRHLRPDVLQVLTPEQFAVAVRSAFKAATRPAELASNPLLRSRILPRPATVGELRDLLGREVEELAADPRRARLARVLTVTYLTPAATQEAAAARLSLPFSTYRRHLATALTIVTDRLWEREVGG